MLDVCLSNADRQEWAVTMVMRFVQRIGGFASKSCESAWTWARTDLQGSLAPQDDLPQPLQFRRHDHYAEHGPPPSAGRLRPWGHQPGSLGSLIR